jgi:hypothetical protein
MASTRPHSASVGARFVCTETMKFSMARSTIVSRRCAHDGRRHRHGRASRRFHPKSQRRSSKPRQLDRHGETYPAVRARDEDALVAHHDGETGNLPLAGVAPIKSRNPRGGAARALSLPARQ